MRGILMTALLLCGGSALAQEGGLVLDDARLAELEAKRAEEATVFAPELVPPADKVRRLLTESQAERLKEFPLAISILVRGDENPLKGAAFLVPGDDALPVKMEQMIPANTTFGSSVVHDADLAITRTDEVQWSTLPGDKLFTSPNGDVLWQSGSKEGEASFLTVRAARLEQLGDGTARLLSGERTVSLIPGVPYDQSGLLFQQPMGVWPSENSESAPSIVRERASAYRPPAYFYRMDEQTSHLALAPHSTLALLNPPAHPAAGAVRYVATDPRLIQFWSGFNQALMQRGLNAHRLTVLRGFVTPHERALLAREGHTMSEYSRHLYGDCIAIVFDREIDNRRTEPQGAPRMSDVNGDGAVDLADVEMLAEVVFETMESLGIYGGVGICSAYSGPGDSKGTPYLHVDLRGVYTPFREE